MSTGAIVSRYAHTRIFIYTRNMFDNSLRKVRAVETAVLAGSNRYVDILEALNIATSDLEEKSPVEARKLKVLTTDIYHALDESYMSVQTVMSKIRADLAEWTSISDEFEKGPISDLSRPVEARLKQQLNEAYDQIMESIDFKTNVLHIIRRTCDSYNRAIISLGDERGITSVDRRVEAATHPLFAPLLSNRVFLTTEVCLRVFITDKTTPYEHFLLVYRKKPCWSQCEVCGQGNCFIPKSLPCLLSASCLLRLTNFVFCSL